MYVFISFHDHIVDFLAISMREKWKKKRSRRLRRKRRKVRSFCALLQLFFAHTLTTSITDESPLQVAALA
jgi:hypothetical protein